MQLVLWRHAEAEDQASSDLARDLTAHGRDQAARMAHWFDTQINGQWGDWMILASPANRARQTAAALGRPLRINEALAPDASVDAVLVAAGWPRGRDGLPNVLIVGHQPTLGMVAARLLNREGGYVGVKKGAMWWFDTRESEGRLQSEFKAMVTPESI